MNHIKSARLRWFFICCPFRISTGGLLLWHHALDKEHVIKYFVGRIFTDLLPPQHELIMYKFWSSTFMRKFVSKWFWSLVPAFAPFWGIQKLCNSITQNVSAGAFLTFQFLISDMMFIWHGFPPVFVHLKHPRVKKRKSCTCCYWCCWGAAKNTQNAPNNTNIATPRPPTSMTHSLHHVTWIKCFNASTTSTLTDRICTTLVIIVSKFSPR